MPAVRALRPPVPTAPVVQQFSTAAGEKLVWKSATDLDGVAGGAEIKATFTVKDHDEFKGHKQTKISRLVVEA